MIQTCNTRRWCRCDRLCWGCCDGLGVHWLGAWSQSVRPGSQPEASLGWRAYAYCRPGLAGETKCMIPSVGKSDRAAREDIVLAHAALGHEEQVVAAVWNGAGSAGCQRLQHVVCTTQGALHHLTNYDLWQSGILRWQSCGICWKAWST